MEFQWTRYHHEPNGDVFRFSGEVNFRDIAFLNLTPLDRALLTDVGRDEKATSADLLLVLEMLFRRQQEHTAKPAADPQPNLRQPVVF